jgi:predicted Fe-Mo cluster-binding NifX family protein
MKVCFAVESDKGIESTVYGHFGSAPAFVTIDTDEGKAVIVTNRDRDHVHGACNPIMAIGGQAVDAVVVGGIGAGAITRLNAEGIKVYRAMTGTVKGNLDLFKEGNLPELSTQHACGGHSEGGGCAH